MGVIDLYKLMELKTETMMVKNGGFLQFLVVHIFL